MRKFGFASLVVAALFAAPAANAYVVFNSPGVFTTTLGAITFATFDAPDVAAVGTTAGGIVNGGTNPGGGGNWRYSHPGTSLVATLAGPASYFGFLWGTNDGGLNQLDLYRGATHLATFSGNGANAFYNIVASNSAEYFDRVEFNTNAGNCCFETDNLAAIVVVPVPATLPLLGLGLAGFAWSRRRKS